jgi:Ca-activated chloride channel family protein
MNAVPKRNLFPASRVALVMIVSAAIVRPQDVIRSFRVESALVTVPAIVSDSRGKFLPGLKAESFKLFQDGIQVLISMFLTSEDPVKIALLLDTSRSTTTVLKNIKKAARRFLRQMRPQDLAMVVSFDSEIQVLCPLSSDQRELQDAIESAKAGGSTTRMRDAIQEIAQRRFRSISGRKAIVLLTDGQDHGSQISSEDLVEAMAASSTLIYSIFYTVDPGELMKELTGMSPRRPSGTIRSSGWEDREQKAAQYLRELSELSSGRFYQSNVTEFDNAFKQISDELRAQYLIGFYPEKSKLDGNTHALELQVLVPDASVRCRKSYRAQP